MHSIQISSIFLEKIKNQVMIEIISKQVIPFFQSAFLCAIVAIY